MMLILYKWSFLLNETKTELKLRCKKWFFKNLWSCCQCIYYFRKKPACKPKHMQIIPQWVLKEELNSVAQKFRNCLAIFYIFLSETLKRWKLHMEKQHKVVPRNRFSLCAMVFCFPDSVLWPETYWYLLDCDLFIFLHNSVLTNDRDIWHKRVFDNLSNLSSLVTKLIFYYIKKVRYLPINVLIGCFVTIETFKTE